MSVKLETKCEIHHYSLVGQYRHPPGKFDRFQRQVLIGYHFSTHNLHLLLLRNSENDRKTLMSEFDLLQKSSICRKAYILHSEYFMNLDLIAVHSMKRKSLKKTE